MKKIIIDGHGKETTNIIYFKTPNGCGRRRLYSYRPANTSIGYKESNQIIRDIINGNNHKEIANYFSSYSGEAHQIADRELWPRELKKVGNEVIIPDWFIPEAELNHPTNTWNIGNVIMKESIINSDTIYLTVSTRCPDRSVRLEDIIKHYDDIEDEIEFYWMACR